MRARVTLGQVQPGNAAEVTRIEQDVVRAYSAQQGFKGHLLLTDDDTGRVVSIVFWERPEDVVANEISGSYYDQLAKMDALFTSPPVRQVYEVSAHTLGF